MRVFFLAQITKTKIMSIRTTKNAKLNIKRFQTTNQFLAKRILRINAYRIFRTGFK